jgi:acyl-coenzyme A synthetase/AMP-(fatty) acid ligase
VQVAAGADPAADLAQLCHDRLPSFARPRRIVPLADFPLTSTGKIDRMALQRLVVG